MSVKLLDSEPSAVDLADSELFEEGCESSGQLSTTPEFEVVALRRREVITLKKTDGDEPKSLRVSFDSKEFVLAESGVGSIFGNFELWINGEPISAERSSSKIPLGPYEGDMHYTKESSQEIQPGDCIQVIDSSGSLPEVAYRISISESEFPHGSLHPPEQDPVSGAEIFQQVPVGDRNLSFSVRFRRWKEAIASSLKELDDTEQAENYTQELSRVEMELSERAKLFNLGVSEILDPEALGSLEQRLKELSSRSLPTDPNLFGVPRDLVPSELLSERDEIFEDLLRAERAFRQLPKKFYPDELDDVASGDVIQLKDGTRVLVESNKGFSEKAIVLTRDGEIQKLDRGILPLLRSGEVAWVERGGRVGLYGGIEKSLYTPYQDKSYFKRGDYIRDGKDHYEVIGPSPEAPEKVQVISLGAFSLWSFRAPQRLQPFVDRYAVMREELPVLKRKVLASERVSADGMTGAQIMQHQMDLIKLEEGFSSKQAKTPERPKSHPLQVELERLYEQLEVEAAHGVQRLSDAAILHDTFEPTSMKVLLETLQELKELRLPMQAAFSSLSDYLLVGTTSEELTAAKTDLELDGDNSPIEKMRVLLSRVRDEIEDRFDGDLGVQDEIADEIFRMDTLIGQSEHLTRRITRRVWRIEDEAEAKPQTGMSTWTEHLSGPIKNGTLRAQLAELASHVPWAATEEQAEGDGTRFHYDPRAIERFVQLPGAELVAYWEKEPSGEPKLMGALVYFPPGKAPKELADQEKTHDFPVSFVQLLIVHPDARGGKVADALVSGHVVHSQRTEAQGYWGTIPSGNIPSFSAQFRNSAVLNHRLQPTAYRFDGSPIAKRGVVTPTAPKFRSAMEKRDRKAVKPRTKLRLLSEEHAQNLSRED